MPDQSLQQTALSSAIAAHRRGDLTAALTGYHRHLKLDPGNVETCNLAADAAFRLKDFKAAAGFLKQVVQAQPGNAQAHYNYGVALKERRQLEEAAAAFTKATELRKDYAAALFQLAVTLTAMGQRTNAVDVYQRVIELEPRNVEALSNCAVLQKELSRHNDALSLYRLAIAIQPEHPGLNYNFGLLLEATERYGQAAEAFQKAVKADPNLVLAHSSLGRIMKNLSRHQESIAHYRHAILLAPSSADIKSQLALALHAAGDFDEALEFHRSAIEIEPHNVEYLCAYGFTLTAAQRYDDAIEVLDRALALKPDDHAAFARKTLALEALGRAGEIISDLRLAFEKQPDVTNLGLSLARTLLQTGDAEAALDVCDQCFQQKPGLTAAIGFRSVALRELGRIEEAKSLVDLDGLILSHRVSTPSGFTSMDDFNAALTQHILTHPTLIEDPPGHATKSGRHTGELLIEPKGPVAHLEQAIKTAVQRYMKVNPKRDEHLFLAARPERWILNVWSVVLEAQGHQIPHIHRGAWLSGVYYAKVPDIVKRSSNSHAGWIEFGQPIANLNCKAAPELRDIQPEEGLMLLFPSYFYHRTHPFDTEGLRISIAFDVIPMELG